MNWLNLSRAFPFLLLLLLHFLVRVHGTFTIKAEYLMASSLPILMAFTSSDAVLNYLLFFLLLACCRFYVSFYIVCSATAFSHHHHHYYYFMWKRKL